MKASLVAFLAGFFLYSLGESGRDRTHQPDARFRTSWKHNNVPNGWEEYRWLRDLGFAPMRLPLLVFLLWVVWSIIY
ncbi:hypothetical protein [Halovibrio salipaludis]|nr:hypothetical protein [Halovibrio salipaludis]